MRQASSQLVHTLGGTDGESLSSIVQGIEGGYSQLAELGQNASEVLVAALSEAHEALIDALDRAAGGQDIEFNVAPVQQIAEALEQMRQAAVEVEESSHDEAVEQDLDTSEAETVPEEETVVEVSQDNIELQAPEALDPELVEIFLEEAEEIFEAMASAKQDWLNDNSNEGAIDALQRALHTLKGSSRMAGLSAIGDLSHELESIYEDVAAERLAPGPELFELVHECDDRLTDMVTEVRGGCALLSRY